MKKDWAGRCVVVAALTAALVVGGTVWAERPDTAAETPPSAELLLENLKSSPDPSWPGASPGCAQPGTALQQDAALYVTPPQVRPPSEPLHPAAVQPRSPPRRIVRSA